MPSESPLTLETVSTDKQHVVEARLEGYAAQASTIPMDRGEVHRVLIALPSTRADGKVVLQSSQRIVERLAVAQSQDVFEDAGVRVMVSPPEALRVLGDKALAHACAQALGIAVPATHVVTDAAGFRAAYDELCRRGLRVCVKPALDHGAAGFRVLDETAGGWADLVLQRAMDALMAFPALVLVLVIVSLLGPTERNVILVLAVVTTPTVNRMARALTLSTRGLPYIESARSVGAS